MLIVIVDFNVAPKDVSLAQSTMDGEAPIVRAMTGNLGYSAWVDPNEPGKLRLMHEWSDLDSFEAYKATPTFKQVGGVLFPLMVGKPSSRAFHVQSVT
jgi:quinol monooxygenase YgiN